MPPLTLPHALLLLATAIVAGGVNAVAGGGSFFSFPALLFVGMPPVQANATNTIALWPGFIASTAAYRQELQGMRAAVVRLCITGAVGGTLGALILLHTPQQTFLKLVPWLLGLGTVLFGVSPAVMRHLPQRPAGAVHASPARLLLHAALEVLISIYIGYFGAGAGILILAFFALLGVGDVNRMNALKTLLSLVANGVAVVAFIAAGAIFWREGLLMLCGAVFGGYAGATVSQRLPQRWTRLFILVTGAVLTVAFFVKYH